MYGSYTREIIHTIVCLQVLLKVFEKISFNLQL